MLRDDRGLMADPTVSRHLRELQAWRALTRESQRSAMVDGDEPFEPSTEPEAGRVRVGLVCPCLGLGGAEVWQLALARAVDPSKIVWKGAAVIEGRGSCDPRMVRELETIMPVGRGVKAAKALAAVSDLIVNWAVTNVAELIEGIDPPPTVMMACHFPGESPWGPGTEQLLASVDRFVAVSELAVESTPPSIRDRLSVIWNAVDADRLRIHRDRATIRASWNVPQNSLIVGYVGRLSPEKDPQALVRLAESLADPWRVVIVGEGREESHLRQMIDSQGLNHVHLIGGDLAVGDVLNGFDALVVPSRYESFGLTLGEGLWMGVPVLATRTGLARLAPGLVREIPVGASGPDLRDALLDDQADVEGTRLRVNRAQAFVRERLTLERFGREWTDLLVSSFARGKGAPG